MTTYPAFQPPSSSKPKILVLPRDSSYLDKEAWAGSDVVVDVQSHGTQKQPVEWMAASNGAIVLFLPLPNELEITLGGEEFAACLQASRRVYASNVKAGEFGIFRYLIFIQ
jgi:hypothetical protein